MTQVQITVVAWNWDLMVSQPMVVPLMVIVCDVFLQDEFQVVTRQWDDSPPNLTADVSDEPLDVSVEIGRVRRENLRFTTNGIKAGANLSGEQRIAVHDNGFHVFQETRVGIGEGASHVQHPGAISMIRNSDKSDFPGGGLDGVECMVPLSPSVAFRNFEGGKVERSEVRPMRFEKSLPVVGFEALRCGRDAMTSQYVCDCSISIGDSQLCQSVTNGILAPGRVVVGHLHDEHFGLRIDARTTGSLRRVGGGDELTMPALEGVDGDDEFLGFEDPSVELVGERSKPSAFIIGWPDPFADQTFCATQAKSVLGWF